MIWCKNYKAIFFLDGNLFVFDISFIYPKSACLLCALCVNVTVFLFFDPKYTVKKPLRNKQVCPKFINLMIENNLLHKSNAKIRCVMLRQKYLRYRCTCWFILVLFVSLWCDVCPQLQCVYPYLLIKLEWNPKLLVLCGTLL